MHSPDIISVGEGEVDSFGDNLRFGLIQIQIMSSVILDMEV